MPQRREYLSQLSLGWSRISLRTRLTGISVAIIALLLAITSIGTVQVLRTYLQQNNDTMLTQTAKSMALEDPLTIEQRLATNQVTLPGLPNGYYIAYLDTDGAVLIGFVAGAGNQTNLPNLTNFTSSAVASLGGSPVDVPDIAKGAVVGPDAIRHWRLVALPLVGSVGSVVVALPQAQSDAILDQYRAISIVFAALLLIISTLSLWLTISSALRPLREVSAAADAVRRGEYERRLLDAPGNTELSRLNRSLNEMLSSIETSIVARNDTLDRMRRFVADASHELRTPLVTLRGYAELYRKGALTSKADVTDAMKHIEAEAVRMTNLVEDLLNLARLDGVAEFKPAKGDLAPLLRETIRNAGVAFDKANIALVDLEGAELAANAKVVAMFDEPQVKQILVNLLSNACRFSEKTSPIEVAAGLVGKLVTIEVRDHGEGIPAQLRSKVFERFYRADSSRNQNTGGTGLGLAIVKAIVERHGGTIVVDETQGGGATFRFTLPTA